MKSTKDINDKMMMKHGFFRCPEMDVRSFNSTGNISYWINDLGIRVVTSRKERMDLPTLIKLVADNAAYQTKRVVYDRMTSSTDRGFVKHK